MTISTAQLDEFHRFATAKLKAGANDTSLEELLRMWRIETDQSATVEAIKQGVADVEAGRCHTLDDVDSEIRRRFEQTAAKESA